MRFMLASALTLAFSHALPAQPLPALVAPTDALSPADEHKALSVPAGFEVQLVASEPDIQKPMQMAFDAKGRLWVTTSYHYPFAAEKGKGTDKLFVLSDFDATGKAKTVRTFAADLNIPIGILPLPDCNSCIVSSVGEILKLTDTDGDGKYDKKEVLFTGFGSRDTHGMYNSYTLMPDGWVYACHGFNNDSTVKGRDGHEVKMRSGNTFRFRPDGSRIEVFSRGQVNPFGMTIDPWFNVYTADCHSKPMTQNIPGATYESFNTTSDPLGFGPVMFGYDPGGTGLCGLSWYDADHFPASYKGMMFLGNVVTNRVNLSRIEWTGSTPKAVQQPDFVTSKDPWFRPVDIKLGPDGALYISDFYNKIIGHYEVDLKHPQRDKDRGRLWRVVWKGKGEPGASATGVPPKMAYTDLTTEKLPRLVELLGHPNQTVRMQAMQELGRRDDKALFLELSPIWAKMPKTDPRQGLMFAIAAARRWVFDNGERDPKWLDPDGELVNGPHGEIVAAQILRMLARRDDGRLEDARAASRLLAAKSPQVRRAALEVIATHPHPDFVKPLIDVIQKCPAGDDHLRHAARIALRNQFRSGDNPNADAWKGYSDVKSISPADAATLLDVSLALTDEYAAEFLTRLLQAGRLPDDRLTVTAEHIGRYGAPADRARAVQAVLKQQDAGKTLAAVSAVLQGVQAAGLKVTRNEANQIAAKLVQLVKQGDAGARVAALKVLGELPGTLPPGYENTDPEESNPFKLIVRFIGDTKEPDDVRGGSLDALIRFDLKQGYATAIVLIDAASTPPALRERAAVLLAVSGDRNHKQAAKDAMAAVPYRSAVVVATALASSSVGGQVLFDAVKQGKAPARVLQEKPVLERLKAAGVPNLDKQLAELTKGLPPADQKIADLLKARAAALPAGKGDKELGAKLYTKHCAACHQIGGTGGKVGPQLDGIGLRGAERLLEDVLDPNRNVDAAFRARILNLKDGTTKSGLMLRVEGEVLVMADDQGKEYRVALKDIEVNRETALSPMPSNFGEVISPEEFNHLMAYLLGQTVNPIKK